VEPANEVLLTGVQAKAAAVMFTRRISQRDYFGVFTVAFGATWVFAHGALFLTDCHFEFRALGREVLVPVSFSRAPLSTRLDVCSAHASVYPPLAGHATGRQAALASFARAIAMRFQRGIETFDQGLAVEWFGQETYRPRLQRARTRTLDGERRDENERQVVSLGKQVSLQLDTAHCWHLNVCNDTRGFIQMRRAQELFGRCKGIGDVLQGSDEIFGCGSN
jgi:hypothetical protein